MGYWQQGSTSQSSLAEKLLATGEGVMVNIELTQHEVELLSEILESYLSDLRMEIADTDLFDFREMLKHKESFIKGLLGRLKSPAQST